MIISVGTQVLHAVDEFQPMFNGKDLSGWVLTNTPSETWSFRDGMLVCTGKPIGEIRTEKMYQNFIMEFEWRHMVPRGNAGLFVWADDITSKGVPFHRGIEVQILENAYGDNESHTTHGDIFPIHGATMTPINGRKGSRAFPTELRSNPSPQWNHYRVECRDGEISLAVNGKEVTRGTNASPRKGYICLESEGGVVHYRNIKIQELPDTEIGPEHVAIPNRGYRSLYTGLNLDGWNTDDKSDWASNDWILAYNGAEGKAGRLSSNESLDMIGFVVDVRLKSETSKIAIQTAANQIIDLTKPEFVEHIKPKEWNRIEGTLDAGKYSLFVNGNPVEWTDSAEPPGKGSLTLLPSGPVEFSNLYARSQTAK
jgi:hypothetical protein